MGNDIKRVILEKISIADVDGLADGDALSFEFYNEQQKLRGFMVKQNGNLHAYLNRCPHTGVNLEWQPNQFFDRTGQFIQCSTHGARFNVNDGLCIFGPCQGRSLKALKIELSGKSVFISV